MAFDKEAAVRAHLKEVVEDHFAGGLAIVMESQEELLKETYGPDFPGSTDVICRNMVADMAILTLLSMVHMSHEAMLEMSKALGYKDISDETKDVMRITGAVYSVTRLGQAAFND